jgi:hypothetical protein
MTKQAIGYKKEKGPLPQVQGLLIFWILTDYSIYCDICV